MLSLNTKLHRVTLEYVSGPQIDFENRNQSNGCNPQTANLLIIIITYKSRNTGFKSGLFDS